MSYLRYEKKDVNVVRFVECYSKYQNESKIVDISTHPLCFTKQEGEFMLHVSGKYARKQILNFQE